MKRSHAVAVRGTVATGIAAVLVAGLTAAVPQQAADEPDDTRGVRAAPVPELDWKPCGDGLADFRCATAEVPTDYDNPDGATTTIALTKLPATKPDRRIGSLFVNPGGPGGSGVQFVQQNAKQAYTPKVRARFDIIGFDPRAVGASDPATCFDSAKEEKEALKGMVSFPVTAKQERRFIRRSAELARHCAATSGNRISHSSTANVARDMDLLRQAVGDDKLNYVGYSYGTYLGATYAKVFPDNIRALVLDGAMDVAAYSGSNGDRRSVGARMGQGPATSETYAQFLRLCREAGKKRCALAKLGNPRQVVERTFDRLRNKPVTIPGPDGTKTEVTYADAVMMVFQGMYDPAGWSDLAETLTYLATAGQKGDRSTARRQIGQLDRKQLRRGDDYASIGSALASTCVDATHPSRPRDYPKLADAENAAAPHFGRARSWVGLTCETFGIEDTDAYSGPWRQSVDEPVLVIGTRFDPATPYDNTRPYTNRFPDGRMLTLNGWGHTIVGKSNCADRKVANYLVDLEARDGATCAPDAKPFTKAAAKKGARLPAVPALF